jgi:hypothetical protein
VENVVAADISEIRVPKTFYNITAANNKLDFNDGVVRVITVPAGAYDAVSLVTEIQTLMNAISTNWVVTYNPLQFTVTINRTAGTNTLLFGTGVNLAASIARALGFAAVDLTGAATYTGPNVVSLQDPEALFIVVNEIGRSGVTSGTLLNYTWHVLMSANNSGDEVTYKNQSDYPDIIKIQKRTIKTLTVQLADDQGNNVNLNGADWSFFMMLYTV